MGKGIELQPHLLADAGMADRAAGREQPDFQLAARGHDRRHGGIGPDLLAQFAGEVTHGAGHRGHQHDPVGPFQRLQLGSQGSALPLDQRG